MPTNFKRSFKPVVLLKPGEVCGWHRHFKRGSAPRSIWGHLEMLDSVKQASFAYTSIKSIQAHARKFRARKTVGTYSAPVVKRVLAFFRELGVISIQFENTDYGMVGFNVNGQSLH